LILMPTVFEDPSLNATLQLAVAFVVTSVIVKLAMRLIRQLGRLRWKVWIEAGLDAVDAPLLVGVPCAVVIGVVPATGVDAAVVAGVRHAAAVFLIIAVGWLIIAVTGVARRVVEHRYRMDVADNLAARSINTKFRVLTRVLVLLVTVFTVGAVLMTFPSIRAVGAGLLASAGVAGLVIGLAARPSIETALASIQIALTEPINIDDVLIVEGEWGRVEEIRATYVVVRIWDDRRLIVPLTYFLEQPFQNWTRSSADITGVVAVTVDYRTPVDAVRAAIKPVIESHSKFDGRFWNVQITDADARGMTLRILCTAADASNAWDLRCDVREALIAWLNEHHPDCLPRVRAELALRPGESPSIPTVASAPS
jgi:small-conductance mechanosensitive channel